MSGDTRVEVTIGDPVAQVNGKAVRLASRAFIRDGRTMVPLAFMGQALNVDVSPNTSSTQAGSLRDRPYDEALKAVQYYLNVDPRDRIGLHLKATIYERKGDRVRALQTWQEAASISLNWYAERQVARLSAKLGLPYSMETVYLENGPPALRRPTAAGGGLPGPGER